MTKVLIHGRDNRIGGADPIPPGEWVYVGDYPTDEDTVPSSPPFQNDWTNAGNGERRLRFRRTNENTTEVAGSVTGGLIGTVVTTVPELYRLTEIEYAAGAKDDMLTIWKFDITGELSVLAVLTVGSGSTTGLHWGTNTDDNNDGLSINTSQSVAFGVDTDFAVSMSGNFDVFGGVSSELNLFADSTGLVIDPTKFEFQLDTGATFTIKNSSGDPIFQMTDGSDDIHIPAGGNVIADL